MKKRMLALLLCLVLTAAMLPLAAFAAEGDFQMEGNFLKQYKGQGGAVQIPQGVTSIGSGAFRKCEGLTGVTVPGSVTSIAGDAFRACKSLTQATLSEGVTSLGSSVFYDCVSLKELTIPSTVTSIGSSLCRNCSSLQKVVILGPVATIEACTFEGCTSLNSITIPASVTAIKGSAFHKVNGDLNIYYEGSEEQWAAVKIESMWNDALKNAEIHYNSPLPKPEQAVQPAQPEQPAQPAVSFTDVPAGEYYAVSVGWAVGRNITTGTGSNQFSPNDTCTQVQILTFLWRAAGQPASTAELPFALRENLSYAQGALRWAAEKGMIDASFDQSAPCTRASAVNYIWKAFGSPAAAGRSFADVPAGEAYAAAVSWAVERSVTLGTSETTFSPDQICNRGQIVTFLYRAYGE